MSIEYFVGENITHSWLGWKAWTLGDPRRGSGRLPNEPISQVGALKHQVHIILRCNSTSLEPTRYTRINIIILINI